MHDYKVPIGPMHPAMKEPMCLRISLDGNYIKDVELGLGYIHRGLEGLFEGKDINNAVYTVERICGICSFAHEECYTLAVEKLMKYKAPEKVRFLRTMIGELERIHSHLMWLGFMSHEIGYQTLFMLFWKEREKVIDIFEKVTGGRVYHGVNKLGTYRYKFTEQDAEFVLKNLESIEHGVKSLASTVYSDSVIKARLRGTATLSKKKAEKFCAVGPVARASGVKNDIRKIDPYEAYGDVKFTQIAGKKGDARERAFVRLNEVFQSIGIVRQTIEMMPKADPPKAALVTLPVGEGYGRVEAPRGENLHYYKIKNSKIERAKIRTPTFAHVPLFKELLIGGEIGDVPVTVGSLDPCFGCMERVILVKDGRTEVLNEQQFRRKIQCIE
jgi:Ni,Fe-hydrogenase III large subunit